MRLARNAVPQDKSDYDRHKAEDKSAQFLYGKTAFVIEVHQRRNDQEQDKYFIKVGNRNMAGIGTQQIAFMPAHQQTDKARHR